MLERHFTQTQQRPHSPTVALTQDANKSSQIMYTFSGFNQSIFYFVSVHIEVILDKNKNI